MASLTWAPGVLLGLLALGLSGCSVAASSPTPTPVPAPPSTLAPQPASPSAAKPGVQAQPTLDLGGANPSDLENAFLSNVDDVIAEANDLTATPCGDLVQVTHDNPNLLPTLRGFAASMKRVSGSQPVLDTNNVKGAMGDLDHTMAQLDGALSVCGITQP